MRTAWELDTVAFAQLLACFDADPELAGAKYVDLRRALVRFFEGRGILYAEEQADKTFDRVARKLAEGEQIDNIYGYCRTVARFILLEAFHHPEQQLAPFDETNAEAQTGYSRLEPEQDLYAECLDECLSQLTAEQRQLIVEYYSSGDRRALAARLGLKREALANRAQRLRNKLEQCLLKCAAKN